MAESKTNDSKKESSSAAPSWVKIKPEELKKIVVDLAKEGKSPAEIGLILRDKHGVPRAKLLGKKITQILKEEGVEFRGEKKIIEKRVETLRKHLDSNKHDYPASRSLTKKLWVLRDLSQ